MRCLLLHFHVCCIITESTNRPSFNLSFNDCFNCIPKDSTYHNSILSSKQQHTSSIHCSIRLLELLSRIIMNHIDPLPQLSSDPTTDHRIKEEVLAKSYLGMLVTASLYQDEALRIGKNVANLVVLLYYLFFTDIVVSLYHHSCKSAASRMYYIL